MRRPASRSVAWLFGGLLGGLLAACRGAAPAARTQAGGADSLVLERSACFGSCPAYRLSVTRAGVVAFASRNHDDSTRAAGEVAPAAFAALVEQARRAGFHALPARLRGDAAFCPSYRTDAPTVRLAIHGPGTTHAVEDYHGCVAPAGDPAAASLAALRALERAVDSVAGADRWARPNRR